MKWADEVCFNAVSQISEEQATADRGSSFQSLYDTLGHIYRAEVIWFRRVMLDPWVRLSEIEVPAHASMLQQLWSDLHDGWNQWAASVSSENGWEQPVPHRNSQGIESTLPRWQIVLHLANHGSYHRGQITTMLRQAGITPPSTDLVIFYRQRG